MSLWILTSNVLTAELRPGVSLTVDDSGHPPESQQDEETHCIKRVFVKDEDDVHDEGHHHHQAVKHLKLVMQKLQAVREDLPSQLHHEEREQREAEVMKHLQGHDLLVAPHEGLARPRTSAPHLRSDVAVLQLDNREIYEQLGQNEDGIQDHQTHHQHLKAARQTGWLRINRMMCFCSPVVPHPRTEQPRPTRSYFNPY